MKKRVCCTLGRSSPGAGSSSLSPGGRSQPDRSKNSEGKEPRDSFSRSEIRGSLRRAAVFTNLIEPPTTERMATDIDPV